MQRICRLGKVLTLFQIFGRACRTRRCQFFWVASQLGIGSQIGQTSWNQVAGHIRVWQNDSLRFWRFWFKCKRASWSFWFQWSWRRKRDAGTAGCWSNWRLGSATSPVGFKSCSLLEWYLGCKMIFLLWFLEKNHLTQITLSCTAALLTSVGLQMPGIGKLGKTDFHTTCLVNFFLFTQRALSTCCSARIGSRKANIYTASPPCDSFGALSGWNSSWKPSTRESAFQLLSFVFEKRYWFWSQSRGFLRKPCRKTRRCFSCSQAARDLSLPPTLSCSGGIKVGGSSNQWSYRRCYSTEHLVP